MTKDPKESQKLKERQKRFVKHYLIEPNATKAAVSADYSENGAEVTGCRLLKNPKVKAAIEEGEAKIAEKLDITAGYVLEKIKDTIEKCSTEKFRPAAVLRGLELLGKYLKLENKVAPEDATFSCGPLPLGFGDGAPGPNRKPPIEVQIISNLPRPDRSKPPKQDEKGDTEKQSQVGAEAVAPVAKPGPATPALPIDRKLVN